MQTSLDHPLPPANFNEREIQIDTDTFNRDISRHHGYLECPVQHHRVNW